MIRTAQSRPRLTAHIGSVVWLAAGVMSACAAPERAFTTDNDVDAGDDLARSSNGHSPDSGASSSGTGEGSSSEPACAAVVCPPDTDCRVHRAPACKTDAGTAACDVVDMAANTPCRNGEGRCDGNGECVVSGASPLGAPCERGGECGSGHCALDQDANGVCCDAACDDVCTVCSAEGRCDEAPAQDPACQALSCPESSACLTYPEPTPGECGGFGKCLTAAKHCVPEYVAAGEECGTGLVCNGEGACVVDCPDESGPERLCTETCPCDVGGGLCTSDTQCTEGLVCTADAIPKLGFPGASCLPEHCVNDRRDAEETSVDCGGGCGCRATYEEVVLSGVPEDAAFGTLNAMSGDGSAFAADIIRFVDPDFSPPYPARVGADGVVTELPSFGVWGKATAINADGSIVVGDLWCDNPPACDSAQSYRAFRWVNGGEPTDTLAAGTAAVVTPSGNMIAGLQSDPASAGGAFRTASGRSILIPQLDDVVAISADGEYVAGSSSDGEFGAIWSATADDVVPLTPPARWTTWAIDVMSDDGMVFAGSSYDGTSLSSYLWENGTFHDFPVLSGADYNYIHGMSADGKVIAGLSGTNSLQRAFIWDQTNGMRTVLAEVTARGLELPPDLQLIGVDHLSDDGRILVGWLFGYGQPAFWRVTLHPE